MDKRQRLQAYYGLVPLLATALATSYSNPLWSCFLQEPLRTQDSISLRYVKCLVDAHSHRKGDRGQSLYTCGCLHPRDHLYFLLVRYRHVQRCLSSTLNENAVSYLLASEMLLHVASSPHSSGIKCSEQNQDPGNPTSGNVLRDKRHFRAPPVCKTSYPNPCLTLLP